MSNTQYMSTFIQLVESVLLADSTISAYLDGGVKIRMSDMPTPDAFKYQVVIVPGNIAQKTKFAGKKRVNLTLSIGAYLRTHESGERNIMLGGGSIPRGIIDVGTDIINVLSGSSLIWPYLIDRDSANLGASTQMQYTDRTLEESKDRIFSVKFNFTGQTDVAI